MQVRSERTLKLRKSHFNVEFAIRNLQKIEHIPEKELFKLIQTKALKMAVFANGGVLAGLKIHHFQGFTVYAIQQSCKQTLFGKKKVRSPE